MRDGRKGAIIGASSDVSGPKRCVSDGRRDRRAGAVWPWLWRCTACCPFCWPCCSTLTCWPAAERVCRLRARGATSLRSCTSGRAREAVFMRFAI